MARSGGKTTRGLEAQERARAARLRLDQEREERDRAIEDAAAEYFSAEDARAELRRQLAAIESAMAASVERLRDLGESTQRIAGLLDLDTKEVRRLLALSTPSAATTSTTVTPAPDGEDAEGSSHEHADGAAAADQPAA